MEESINLANSINRLQYLVEIIPTKLLNISEPDFCLKIETNKWSKKEILGHLIDSAANNHQRFIRIQYENKPTIFYEQNKWNELNNYQQLSSQHVISFWTIYNQHLLEIIKQIPTENLTKEGYVGDNKKETLQFLITDYVSHLEHHLKQIISL